MKLSPFHARVLRRFAAIAVAAVPAALLLAACAAPKPKPCPPGTSIHFAEALDLAWKAERAYQTDSAILEGCGIDSCFVVTGPVTGARAFVQRDDAHQLQWIAFRGTQSEADARLDARYVQAPDSSLQMLLHEGFSSAASEVLPAVSARLRPGYRTWITGHSLGGAMAVIAGLELRSQGIRARVVTFGQPKVTNTAGARRADTLLDLTRFVHGRDAVAQMPPLDWKPGGRKVGSYAHFGREVLLGDSAFACRLSHTERKLDLSYWRDPLGAEALAHHRMEGYLDRLEKLMLANPSPLPGE